MSCRRCGKQKPEERWSYEKHCATPEWFIDDLCDPCARMVCEEDKRRKLAVASRKPAKRKVS